MRAPSNGTDNPCAAGGPFDPDGAGLVLPGGAGIVTFENLRWARPRGGNIYAGITGMGSAPTPGTSPNPTPKGQERPGR